MPRDVTQLGIDLYDAYFNAPIPYAYAVVGQKITAALAKAKANQVINGKKPYLTMWTPPYGTGTGNRLKYSIQFAAPWGCDCIAWIRILCLYDAKVNPLPFSANPYFIKGKNYYNTAGMDISANGACNAFGSKPISSLPEPTPSKAVVVFMPNSKGQISHIGLYIGKGRVIEQTPPKLVMTKTSNRKWTRWAYLPDKWRDFMEKTVGLGASMDCSVKGGKNNVTTTDNLPIAKEYRAHTVVKGDSPWAIAEKLSGNGANYTKLVWLKRSDGGKAGTYRECDPPVPYVKNTNIYAGEIMGYPT